MYKIVHGRWSSNQIIQFVRCHFSYMEIYMFRYLKLMNDNSAEQWYVFCVGYSILNRFSQINLFPFCSIIMIVARYCTLYYSDGDEAEWSIVCC